MNLLPYFDGYVSKGLKPIAVYKYQKRPVGEFWNKNWSINRWRPYFETDKYNMGIILGDIIDVEGDSEEACEFLEKMIKNVKRPNFRSSKSVHNLFLNPDPNLTRTVINGIEFRGYLHQSVVPPSFHSKGCKYSFLDNSKWPIPPMPDELKDFYFKNKKEVIVKKPRRKKIKQDYKKTTCNICKDFFYIHEKRLLLEVKAFKEFNLLWMCRGCRKIDIKKTCNHLREKNVSMLKDI